MATDPGFVPVPESISEGMTREMMKDTLERDKLLYKQSEAVSKLRNESYIHLISCLAGGIVIAMLCSTFAFWMSTLIGYWGQTDTIKMKLIDEGWRKCVIYQPIQYQQQVTYPGPEAYTPAAPQAESRLIPTPAQAPESE